MQPAVIETGPETRYQTTVALLERLDPVPEGLIVASPSNPAGTMLHPEELAAIAGWCDVHGVRLISDEIYHGLHYGSPIATAAAYSPHAVVVNSFSKYFSMTGWRIGWMVLPEDLVRPVECLAQNLFISPPHIAQIAAEAAFDCHDELQGNVARYRRSRDLLLGALPASGFPHLSPAEGAFYLYADVGDRTNDSAAFCARMLAEAGIAATPGLDFDRRRGARTMRFSYCGPEADMAEAAERLRHWR
jgi:aspartate/methionine/tyrosine aminotransferase